MGTVNDALRQEQVRAGATYYSPAHLMNVVKHHYGTPYWMQPAGLPIQTMMNVTVSAPARQSSKAVYSATGAIQTTVIGSGSAPTSGIYTGVEDHCG